MDQSGVHQSVDKLRKLDHYNLDGTINFLYAARKHDIDWAVISFSSSVYGKPECFPYDEANPTNPVSPYGVSKLATEQYARVYSEIYGLPTVSFRYITMYGPRMRTNMVLMNFVTRCLHGEPSVIYVNGSKTRDFTSKDDSDRVNEQLLTVGSTNTINILPLAEIIRDEIDPSLDIEFDEVRRGDAEHTVADISKASELLGYEPTVDIREGPWKFID